MIRWTTAGAVSTPTTVQIRVQRSYPGRVRAGAPEPSRSLSPEELLGNIRHFTAGLRGPRTIPCTGLVLSGMGVGRRPELPDAIRLAREEGMQRVVLHVELPDLEGLDLGPLDLDVLVVPVQPGPSLEEAASLIARAAARGLKVATNTVLSESALPELGSVARVLARARPDALTFTFPFPLAESLTSVPRPERAVQALGPVLDELAEAGLEAQVKGLPACFLGEHARHLRRTGNRWYVDADHQKNEALLFFPDVVGFFKGEACRFCTADDRCDGFFERYLRLEGWPALQALEPAD